jgi:hypothetical protein
VQVDVGAVELQAVQLFIFTGSDAVMQAEEAEALRVFHGRCVRGSVRGLRRLQSV